MLNARHAAAQSVAAELFPTEDNLQDTILGNARLQIAIVQERRNARLPKNIGTVALVHAAEAGRLLADAWSSIVAAHSALHEDQRLAGLSAFSYGDNDGQTPKSASLDEERAPLRAA